RAVRLLGAGRARARLPAPAVGPGLRPPARRRVGRRRAVALNGGEHSSMRGTAPGSRPGAHLARPAETAMAAGLWRARVQLQLPFGKPASPDAPPAPPVAQPAPPAPVPPRAARNGAAPDAPAPKPRGRKRPPAPPPPATSATSAEALDEPMPADADAPDDAAPAPVAPSADALVLEVQVNRRLRRTYRWRIVGERLIVERPERVSDRDLRATLATIRERAAAYLRRQT